MYMPIESPVPGHSSQANRIRITAYVRRIRITAYGRSAPNSPTEAHSASAGVTPTALITLQDSTVAGCRAAGSVAAGTVGGAERQLF
jgi:hypothetical protein